MTLPRLIALVHYWDEKPPVHEAFAAFVGMGTSTRSQDAPAAEGSDDAFDNLVRDFNGL